MYKHARHYPRTMTPPPITSGLVDNGPSEDWRAAKSIYDQRIEAERQINRARSAAMNEVRRRPRQRAP